MAKYKKKQVVIDAITFDEFVQYGKDNGGNIVNGMPWSFKYNGHPITNENNECYLIPTLEGTFKFTPNDMLITGVSGEIYPCKIDIFNLTYEPVGEEKNKKLLVVFECNNGYTCSCCGRWWEETDTIPIADDVDPVEYVKNLRKQCEKSKGEYGRIGIESAYLIQEQII